MKRIINKIYCRISRFMKKESTLLFLEFAFAIIVLAMPRIIGMIVGIILLTAALMDIAEYFGMIDKTDKK